MKHIQFFSLARQWDEHKTKLQNALDNVLQSQQFIGGSNVEQFEKKLASYVGSTHAIACNSGTDALWLALKVLQVNSSTIVLTTPFSFIASSSEIVAHGGHPVFIDIDEESYNIDPIKLKNWLTSNTIRHNHTTIHKDSGLLVTGIVTVDLFGQCADYDAIKAIAQEWNLWIVEDACQAIGAEVNGKKTGTLGDITAFSFYPTKNLGAFGDGGALTTSNPYFAEQLLLQRNHGRLTHYDYKTIGINSRLDGMQAAILSTKLDIIDELNDKRRTIAAIYNKELAGLPGIKLPKQTLGKHVFHQYSLEIRDAGAGKNRSDFCAYLAKRGVETRIFYPQALHLINFLTTNALLKKACQVAENAIQNIVSLPIWPELTHEEVAYVCQIIKDFALMEPKLTTQEKTISR